MQFAIFLVAMGFAILCFVAFLIVTLKHVPDAQEKAGQAVQQLAPSTKAAAISPQDVGDIVKALASLVDSLVKAGPALWSLIGSMLFLLIASLAAGLIGSNGAAGSDVPNSKPANTAQKQAKATDNQADAAKSQENSAQNSAAH